MNIFSGRLIFAKTNKRFAAWVEAYSRYYRTEKPSVEVKSSGKITFSTAWFSGLIDAEGCFTAVKRSGRASYRMRFTIKQKYEYEVFKHLPYVCGEDKKLGHVTNRDEVALFTIDAIKGLDLLVDYLDKFPLRSKKNVAYTKWLSFKRIVEKGPRTYDFDTVKQLAEDINSIADEDKVHDLDQN